MVNRERCLNYYVMKIINVSLYACAMLYVFLEGNKQYNIDFSDLFVI